MKLIFLDTETTGIKDGRLVELAMNHGGLMAEIRVLPPEEISFEAMAVHHITEKMVADLPKFLDHKDYELIRSEIENNVVVAHNAPFDIGVLNREGINVNRFIDTQVLAKKVFPHIGKYSLQYLRYWLGIEVEVVSHSASGDVTVLMAVWDKLLEQFMKDWNCSEQEAIESNLQVV